MTFRSTIRPRAKLTRECPECRIQIEPGTHYVRWACMTGDYGFCSGFHCTVCEEVGELYFEIARGLGQALADEVTYPGGELISEAAQTVDLYWIEGWHAQSLLAQRDAVLAALRVQVAARRQTRRRRSLWHARARQLAQLVRARCTHAGA